MAKARKPRCCPFDNSWRRPWGTQTKRVKREPFRHTMPFATIPKRYGVKGWGRKGFATPKPFAKIPMRYGVKG
uniref:Uncharacterized protein n=1 Tax=Oryza sativa subsp. japonica TaxID=39947 RepID=Q8H416_ORYSJ|nr:hypothetical protein [Oryza sativa Japonica Group]BAD31970.1 hypothetical protein [Oryza sativa Japonica Group]